MVSLVGYSNVSTGWMAVLMLSKDLNNKWLAAILSKYSINSLLQYLYVLYYFSYCNSYTFLALIFMYDTCRRMSRNEVYAQAVLGKHSHVVRYYSAWAEDGYMYIQTEYCNGGSLAEEISTHIKRGTNFTEPELKEMLRQVA